MDLLNELTSSTSGFEILEEKVNPNSSWKSLKIRGVFQRADSKNQNGRIYPFGVLDRAIQECSESLLSRNMFGELDHPADQSPTVSLKNVSHVVTNLKFSGKDVIGEAVVFDDPGPAGTPAGRLLGALIRNNCTVGISSRGYGSVANGYEGTVVEEYKLVTFDCVHDPSTHKAFVQPVNEGIDYQRQLKAALEREKFIKDLRTDFSTMLLNKQ
jgi:hypothetical protein